MKNYLLTMVIALILSSSTFSQNSNQVKLSQENKELLEEFKAQENERLERVKTFLNQNPNVSTTYRDSFNITYIYDIFNGKPVYKSTDNIQAARGTKTVDLWSGGNLGLDLDGLGMTIGVWDGGPADNNHVEFENASGTDTRIQIIDNTVVDGDTGFSSHGTHVTGTISAKGNNSSAKGMAYNVNVKSYNWTNDEFEMVNAANDINNPIIISNHSYGLPIDQNGEGQLDASFIGSYTQDARDIDNISRNNPKYLIVTSAGNSGTTTYPGGNYPGYDKLTNDKNAKNSLVVANANPSVVEQPIFSGNFEITNLAINSSSSQGPTDDLRIKPDLAGDGTNLLSPTPNNTYSTFSGTSMSSPNVAGTLLLLQQYYNQLHGTYMNSSTLKGLVCHTAIDDNNVGPDPKFGWGFLNARYSVETIAGDMVGDAVIDELNLNEDEVYTLTFLAQAGEKLSATICWTDMPGQVFSGTANDPTPRLVNDLDLRISDGNTVYFPWKLDFSAESGYSNSKADNNVDNIERVDIETPTSGMYTLTVTHKGTLQGNTGGPFDPQSQDFSLILTGSNLTLSATDFTLDELKIWPNPAKDNLNIRFKSIEQRTSITLVDIQGREVYRSFIDVNSPNMQTINTAQLSNGVYLLKVYNSSQQVTKKVIIE